MANQNLPNKQQPRSKVAKAESALSEFNASAASLRTEADRARGIFGIGRRILVPPDEIHVIVGDGRHTWLISNARKVFGQSADRPARYWLNKLTQVIKLKTISFTVPIRGNNDEGVEALDNSKVSFKLWAHAVAKLNPDKAEIAAQRVGLDTAGLINTIMEVGKAELIAAAATMELQKIIANRQKLAEIAFPKVNQILSELGYDLALLTITKLDGVAYGKLVEQAESRVSKETSIATNLEQVAELKDDQARERTEAEIKATTEKKLAFERLEAKREVETTSLDQEEALAVRRHEVNILQTEREKAAAEISHERDLTKVQLDQKLGEGEAEKEARISRIKTERSAELRSIEQKRNAEIKLAESEAEAKRLAVVQARDIERKAELTQAEAKRLKEEELAKAERAKDVALTEANQIGEALKVEAQAKAQALQTQTTAETKAELLKADAEANASQKRAEAAKIRAEATRAETAAPGLAEAEVEAARVEVAEKQVAVNRADGLAQAEVAQAQAEAEADRRRRLKEVDINAQKQLIALYDKAPVLVELEKIRMQYEHKEKITTMQMDAYLEAFKSIAPGVRINIFGSGDQTSHIFNNLMTFTHGLNSASDQIPFLKQLISNGKDSEGLNLLKKFQPFMPYLQEIFADMKPRIFSSLKITDVVERLEPVVAGQEDLTSALTNIKDDASFRVVGDLPVKPLLGLLGIEFDEGDEKKDEIIDLSEDEPTKSEEILEADA